MFPVTKVSSAKCFLSCYKVFSPQNFSLRNVSFTKCLLLQNVYFHKCFQLYVYLLKKECRELMIFMILTNPRKRLNKHEKRCRVCFFQSFSGILSLPIYVKSKFFYIPSEPTRIIRCKVKKGPIVLMLPYLYLPGGRVWVV